MIQNPHQQPTMPAAQPCPTCRQPMSFVARERAEAARREVVTFQCLCGQIFSTRGV
jgi:hypothetical protein